MPEVRARHAQSWWRVLLIGFGLFAVGVAVLALTANPILFPTVVMIGSFTVPAAYVAFFYDHRHLSRLTMPTTVLTFVYGGLLGVLAAAILEPIFIRRLTFTTAFGVALIEEFAKVLGVLVIARRIRHDSELDGIILGAAAGMGFAALESMGYAFTAYLQEGQSLSRVVAVTLARGFISPVGHGTWTAILTGVLFRESGPYRFHLDIQVVLAYFTVATLHGLWDGLPSLLSRYFAPGVDVFVGEAIVGGIGLFILWWLWREAVRRQAERAADDSSLESR